MARGLDDAALEALASRGLVRRAAADLAAGKASLLAEAAGEIQAQVDGETVRLLASGPAHGGCSCPAPGVCRHRLTALMLLREDEAATAGALVAAEAGADASTSSMAPPDTDWAAVMAALDGRAMARFAGLATWRAALQAAAPPAAAELRMLDGSLQVCLANEAPVVFLRDGGLAAALTKAPERRRKAVVTLAALLARRALNLPDIEVAAEAVAEPGAEPSTSAMKADSAADLASLAAAQGALQRCLAAGLAFAPPAAEAELQRVALAGRVEAIPRLSALLRRLAAGLVALRARGVEGDPEAILRLMAEAFALTMALQAAPDDAARTALTGQLRQDYASAGALELFGLGARLWSSPTGAHGVTGYFHAPLTGRSFTLGHARPNQADVTFHPRAAFQQTPLWGQPLARLCAGRLTLDPALASPGGRLSTAPPSRARFAAWTPTVEAVQGWACVFDDWAALEADLQDRLAGGLSRPAIAETPVILRFARFAALRFDELDQTLVWPLADRAGRWIGLTLTYEAEDRDRIEALEALVSRERPWAVLATAQPDAGRLVLQPYALWGQGQHLLDTPPPRRPQAGILGSGLVERLRAAARGPGPQGFSLSATVSDRLVAEAWALLLRRAEIGRGLPDVTFAEACGAIAGRLTLAGLSPLARPFESLAAAPGRPDLTLRAAWAVTSAQQARRRLDWMR